MPCLVHARTPMLVSNTTAVPTGTFLTVSTVSYAAPEQLMGHDIDGRTDQYALASTAFQLLTGAPPHENSNPVAVISAHLTAPPPHQRERPGLARLDACWPPPWPRRLQNAL